MKYNNIKNKLTKKKHLIKRKAGYISPTTGRFSPREMKKKYASRLSKALTRRLRNTKIFN